MSEDFSLDSDTTDRPTIMLTTSDNPFSPFSQFDEWYQWDTQHGYNTCSYLARIACDSHELSNLDRALSIELAIEEILQFNLTAKYIAVSESETGLVTREGFKA